LAWGNNQRDPREADISLAKSSALNREGTKAGGKPAFLKAEAVKGPTTPIFNAANVRFITGEAFRRAVTKCSTATALVNNTPSYRSNWRNARFNREDANGTVLMTGSHTT